jgi:hypothetical protein
MDDLHAQIDELVAREHALREGPMDDASRAELAALEARLDQAWDLLRQRAARREAGEDPALAKPRPVTEVEEYLQ